MLCLFSIAWTQAFFFSIQPRKTTWNACSDLLGLLSRVSRLPYLPCRLGSCGATSWRCHGLFIRLDILNQSLVESNWEFIVHHFKPSLFSLSLGCTNRSRSNIWTFIDEKEASAESKGVLAKHTRLINTAIMCVYDRVWNLFFHSNEISELVYIYLN
jgi:hypothetical protein